MCLISNFRIELFFPFVFTLFFSVQRKGLRVKHFSRTNVDVPIDCGDEQADAERDCRIPSRSTKLEGAIGDRYKYVFPLQLTTCRIGNLNRLIHPACRGSSCSMCDNTYIHTCCNGAPILIETMIALGSYLLNLIDWESLYGWARAHAPSIYNGRMLLSRYVA